MMLLNKLYSEPSGLFKPIQFKNGINFIFAKKDNASNNKRSLNGVGKSLLLNFLDYALLSSETAHIKSVKKDFNIDHYSIVLEFESDGKSYIVKRPLKTPNKNILFGEKDGKLRSYDLPKKNINKILSQIICDLSFKNNAYNGKYFNTWLRQLMPFFVKKQEDPKKKVNFADPIKFSQGTEMELIIYHLFFMGMHNALFYANFEVRSELKRQEPALEEIRKLVTDTYNVQDIDKIVNIIDNLKSDIYQDEKNINNFKLATQYKNVEAQCNKLTASIKDLWYNNHIDKEKIKTYKNSFKLGDLDDVIKTSSIEKLYGELNKLLANNIKKTLDDAINFRKNISQSRMDFLASEIENVEKDILQRDKEINSLEKKRSQLFKFLEAKEAIKDLSEAFLDLSRKKEKLSDLEGKIRTFRDLQSDIIERETAITNIYQKITEFIRNVSDKISAFRKTFFEIHNKLYPENRTKEFGFTFEPNKKKHSLVNIDVYLPDDLAKGKNKGRTLIYDLSILFHAIDKNFNLPRFLVHDGIFDGMDKAHFISLYEYLEEKAKNSSFQYIVTVNEEGTLSQEFGNSDKVTPEKMEKEAIIVLTPTNKLLKIGICSRGVKISP